MTTIIDYQTGNLSSIANMLRKCGDHAVISSSPDQIADSDRLILPGVGHFDFGMRQLKSLGLIEVLHEQVLVKRKPILGICLGAQLMLESSEEGTEPGLAWIKGSCKKFDIKTLPSGYKVPHMGWSEIQYVRKNPFWVDLGEEPRFYFVHSYYMHCTDADHIIGEGHYGFPFTAAFSHQNIWGVQFHPEKSHKYGMQLLRNFLKIKSI